MTQVTGGGVPPGTRLNDMYEIVQRIGVGGMGEVYVAREIHSGNQVAIKMVLPEFSRDPMVIDLFRREAAHLSELRHEAIIRYSAFAIDPHVQRPYLAMEFTFGPSLRERLRRGRGLTDEEFDHLRRRVAGGLAAAHRAGIFHRDIAPDNIILADDNVARAMIIDFGIAKSTHDEKTILGDSFAGKMGYASPEQLGLVGGKISEKTDVYALGLVFAEALTAQSMNMGGSHAEALEKRKSVPDLSHLPERYRPLVARMLEPEPSRRPTMEEIVAWEPGKVRQRGNGSGGFLRGALMLVLAAVVTGAILVGLWYALTPGTSLMPPSQTEIAAAEGTAGQPYDWKMAPFKYTGEAGTLRITSSGALPDGLSLVPGADGSVTISGTPVAAAGPVTIEIFAEGEDDTRAAQKVVITITAPPNTPPSVVERPGATVELTAGEAASVRLGSFADDKGPGALSIGTSGALPRGLTVDTPQPGVARLSGTPAAEGTFTFDVEATDAEGETAAFPVTVTVASAPIDTSQPIRHVVATANGTDCVFVRIVSLAGDDLRLEGFVNKIEPLNRLDSDVKREMGREANITAWPVTAFQCRFIDMMAALDPAMFEHDSSISIPEPTRPSGSQVSGTVVNGADALLYLIDEDGRASELQAEMRVDRQDLRFQTRLRGHGPQLIVAAVPSAPGTLAGARTLIDILRPSMRGRVKLAIGYVDLR